MYTLIIRDTFFRVIDGFTDCTLFNVFSLILYFMRDMRAWYITVTLQGEREYTVLRLCYTENSESWHVVV